MMMEIVQKHVKDKMFWRNMFTESRNISLIASEIPDVMGNLTAWSYCKERTVQRVSFLTQEKICHLRLLLRQEMALSKHVCMLTMHLTWGL